VIATLILIQKDPNGPLMILLVAHCDEQLLVVRSVIRDSPGHALFSQNGRW
jgi:hypothetical protein